MESRGRLTRYAHDRGWLSVIRAGREVRSGYRANARWAGQYEQPKASSGEHEPRIRNALNGIMRHDGKMVLGGDMKPDPGMSQPGVQVSPIH